MLCEKMLEKCCVILLKYNGQYVFIIIIIVNIISIYIMWLICIDIAPMN
jgi:hypothetical protein